MDFNISVWLKELEKRLQETFKNNLLYIGLQGSYARDEADRNSDVDVVVILNNLSMKDLQAYKSIINNMPYKEKSCGFVSGKEEIQNWSKEDLFQFFYDTKNIYGKIEDIITPPTTEEIKKSNKQALENLYHATLHSYLHSENLQEVLVSLYKTTFFILQAKYFIQNGEYIRTKQELLSKLSDSDNEILTVCINKNLVITCDNAEYLYLQLVNWLQHQLKEIIGEA